MGGEARNKGETIALCKVAYAISRALPLEGEKERGKSVYPFLSLNLELGEVQYSPLSIFIVTWDIYGYNILDILGYIIFLSFVVEEERRRRNSLYSTVSIVVKLGMQSVIFSSV